MIEPDTRAVQVYVPEVGPRQAILFEPRNAGGWDRITYEFRRGRWVPTGSEIVAQLEIATGNDVGTFPRREGPPKTGP